MALKLVVVLVLVLVSLTVLLFHWVLLVFQLAFQLALQMRCCVLAVLVSLTLTVLVPSNPRNQVEMGHWMRLYYLHVGFWVQL
jgi:hypothetical protein